jgi:hypothetical protein
MKDETKQKMDSILESDVVDRHSFFQLKYFVIGKEPTVQAMLWRCVRELKARKESIASIKREIDDTRDRIELLKIDIEDSGRMTIRQALSATELDERRNEIKKRRFSRKIESLEETIVNLQSKLKYTEEEAEFFCGAFESLSKKEKLLPFDDEASQTQYWNEKLGQELHLRLMLQQPVDPEIVKTILSLEENVKIREQTVKMLSEPHQASQRRLDSR